MNPVLYVYEKQDERTQDEAREKIILEDPDKACAILKKARACVAGRDKHGWLENY